MATSGALGPFLSAMLQLRAQRLQEEEAKARASQAGMSSLMSGISGAASSIMGGIKAGQENQMYNRLSQEAFGGGGGLTVGDLMANAPGTSGTGIARPLGRLSAADTSAAPSDFTLPVTSTPNRFTGGKAEFEARMKMMGLRDKIDRDKREDLYKAAAYNRAEGYYTRSGEQAKATARAAELKARNDAFAGMSKQAQDIYKDSEGYLKSATGIRADLEKALEGDGDETTFNQRAMELMALNSLKEGRKLTVPLMDVPAFFPKNQQKLLDDYTAARAAAEGAPATKGLLGRPSPEAQALQQAGAEATGVSVPYPGGAPRYAPATTPLSAELVNRAQQNPQQVSPEEAQQLGMQAPAPASAPGAPAPGAPAPGAPAPGARPLTAGGGKFIYNHQTGKWDPTGK